VGIEFGTVGVLDSAGVMHEVTTFRRDVHTDGRHAVVEFGASLDEDLARRDFTINAIAFDPIDRRLHDPFAGQADLTAKLVRAVGDAEARLNEDRLRALRAIRFASRFEFEIEASTWRAIVGSAPFLGRLSPERVKQELEKTMEQVRRPSTAFRRWRDSDAFRALIPALAGVSDNVLAAVDALPLPAMRTRPQRRSLRMAALLSELDGGDAESALRALRCSNQDISWISGLVRLWHTLGVAMTAAMCAETAPSDADLRRLAARTGRLRLSQFLRLAAAHWSVMPALEAPAPERVREVYKRALRIAFRDPIELADLAVDGDDLRAAGIPAGPMFGPLLASLLHDVVEDPTRNDRARLLDRAREFALNWQRPSGEAR
jgi:tRNA nucleotidyltransferase (CCA-adding enzyme)